MRHRAIEMSIFFWANAGRISACPPRNSGVILIPLNEYNSAELPPPPKSGRFYGVGLMKAPAPDSDVTVLPSKIGLPRRKVARV
ncbi:hypothetical protein V1283_005604 [Bradyrhizobium sp. AZCC 2262]